MKVPEGFAFHQLPIRKIIIYGRLLVLTWNEELRKESAVIGSMNSPLVSSIKLSLAMLYTLAQQRLIESAEE